MRNKLQHFTIMAEQGGLRKSGNNPHLLTRCRLGTVDELMPLNGMRTTGIKAVAGRGKTSLDTTKTARASSGAARRLRHGHSHIDTCVINSLGGRADGPADSASCAGRTSVPLHKERGCIVREDLLEQLSIYGAWLLPFDESLLNTDSASGRIDVHTSRR